MIKRFTAFSYLFLLLVPFAVVFFALKAEHYQHRKKVKHQLIASIDRDELVLLGFKNSEMGKLLRWEHSKEFEYQGEMYDVVERQSTADSMFFWCWWDNDETQLHRKLDRLLALSQTTHSPFQKRNDRLLNVFKSMRPEHGIQIALHAFVQTLKKSPAMDEILAMSYAEAPPAPPPEQF